MRYFKYLLLAAIAVVLVCVSLANREMVMLELLPADLAGLMGMEYSINLPLFVIIFGGVGVGLMVGFVWEWIREHKQRAEAAAQRREMDRMNREIKRLRADKLKGKDDVLAILDETS